MSIKGILKTEPEVMEYLEMLQALIADIALFDLAIDLTPIEDEEIIKIKSNRIALIERVSGQSWEIIREIMDA